MVVAIVQLSTPYLVRQAKKTNWDQRKLAAVLHLVEAALQTALQDHVVDGAHEDVCVGQAGPLRRHRPHSAARLRQLIK